MRALLGKDRARQLHQSPHDVRTLTTVAMLQVLALPRLQLPMHSDQTDFVGSHGRCETRGPAFFEGTECGGVLS